MSHTVLLVDDEPSLLAGLARTLRKEPYRILTAVSAEKALETLGATHVDVVISDQDMPGMGGADLLAEVRRVYPDTVRFMLTGKATLELAVRAINDGAVSRFFVKPCNPVDLAATIRQALQHKDLVAEAWALLEKVKRQDVILDRLERQSPGITRVHQDEHGAICLEETGTAQYERLLAELRAATGKG